MQNPVIPPVNAAITIQPLATAVASREGSIPPALQGLAVGALVKGFVVNRDAAKNPILRTPLGDLVVKSEIFLKTGSDVVVRVDPAQPSLAKIISIDGQTPQEYAVRLLPTLPAGDQILTSSLLARSYAAPTNVASAGGGSAVDTLTIEGVLITPAKFAPEFLPPAIQARFSKILTTLLPDVPLSVTITGTIYPPTAAPGVTTPAEPLLVQPFVPPSPRAFIPPPLGAPIAGTPQPITPPDIPTPLLNATPPQAGSPIRAAATSLNPASPPTLNPASPTTVNPASLLPPPLPITTTSPAASTASTAITATSAPSLPAALATSPNLQNAQPVATPMPASFIPATNQITNTTPNAAPNPAPNAAPNAAMLNYARAALPPEINPNSVIPEIPPQARAAAARLAADPVWMREEITRLVAAQTAQPQTPPPGIAPSFQMLKAEVIGYDKSGGSFVQTALGTLHIKTAHALPGGTQLTIDLAPAPITAAQTASIALLPESLDAFTYLAQEWKSMKEVFASLTSTDPALAAALAERILPKAHSKLSNEMLFFLAAIKKGDVGEWLGKSARDLLAERAPEALGRLSREFTQLQQSLADPAAHGWTGLVIPFLSQGQIQQMRLFLKHDEEAAGSSASKDGQRFVIELDLSSLGDMQLDGFVKTGGTTKEFDLVVRSARHLPEDVRQGIRQIFEQSLTITGMRGYVGFQEGREHFLRPLSEVKNTYPGDPKSIFA
jgi:hypothetical protein